MKDIIKKYKGIILYGFFGVCTTIVNIVSYWILAHIFYLNTIISTMIAWIIAVLFAYFTNRNYVFNSEAKGFDKILREMLYFFACRLLTGLLDLAIMYIFVDVFGFDDIFIKVISNIIVIILNYVFSKLIIFNVEKNNDLLKKKIDIRKIIGSSIIIIFFSLLSFLFLMNSPLHICNNYGTSIDSSVFKTIALMMDKGYTPYVDTFDHKGPLLYIINYIGLKIAYYKGTFILEFINLVIFFLFSYKIARLKCNKIISAFIVLLSSSLLFSYFDGGNLTEEYSLSFIIISLFIFIDYYVNNKISKCRLLMNGFCLGGVLMLRPNMISLWIVFCIAILIKCIRNKEYKELMIFILYFFMGMCIMIVPIILWLAIKGALFDFFNDYIVFNRIYCVAEGGRANNITRWSSFFTFFNNKLLLCSIIICFYSCYIKKEKELSIINIIYIFITLLLICISGMKYDHYGMILVPVIIFPFSLLFELFVNSIENKKERTNNNIVLVIVIYLFLTYISVYWLPLIENVPLACSTRYDNHLLNDVNRISSIVKENTDSNDLISVYGNWDLIYVISKRGHATKYSYQFPVGEVFPKIREEYFLQLNQEMPKIIVVEKKRRDEKIEAFLSNNNYILLNDSLEESLIYRRVN